MLRIHCYDSQPVKILFSAILKVCEKFGSQVFTQNLFASDAAIETAQRIYAQKFDTAAERSFDVMRKQPIVAHGVCRNTSLFGAPGTGWRRILLDEVIFTFNGGVIAVIIFYLLKPRRLKRYVYRCVLVMKSGFVDVLGLNPQTPD